MNNKKFHNRWYEGERTTLERFLSHVEVSTDGCWLWAASKNKSGYGQFNPGEPIKRPMVAHKWYYELKNGPVPPGLELDHLCRIRHCVNPDHLEAVSHRVNTLRGESPTAQLSRQAFCKNGHVFSTENTIITKNGYRKCRTCENARKKLKKVLLKSGTFNPSQKNKTTKTSKFNLETISTIRKLYATGQYTQKQLSITYGCSDRHIGQIVNFEVWR